MPAYSLLAFLLSCSLSLQAPLDKSTLCANKISLYIALIFFLADNNRVEHNSEKGKLESGGGIQFSVRFWTRASCRRQLGLQSAADAQGQTFLSVCISVT